MKTLNELNKESEELNSQATDDELRRMKIRKKLKDLIGDWKPDWGKAKQDKWSIFYDHNDGEFKVTYSLFYQSLDEFYFPSLDIAKVAIDTMNDDLKFLAGVK